MMFLFIGEKRSPTAIAKGWTWESGHLAANTLDDALEAAGLDLFDYACMNILTDDGAINRDTLATIGYSLYVSKMS